MAFAGAPRIARCEQNVCPKDVVHGRIAEAGVHIFVCLCEVVDGLEVEQDVRVENCETR
jgi:hypothetical protein